MHTHKAKYSWYNINERKAYYWEDKELLQYQRNSLQQECINVENDAIISKKQMRKGIPEALRKRVNKNT